MKLWKSTIVLALSALPLLAGGLTLETTNPASNPEAMSMGAVLTARITACHSPEKTVVTATAEGFVDGSRRAIPLKVIALHTPGTFAIKREWPETGNWVVRLVASNPDYGTYKTGVVVPASGNTIEWAAAKHFYREPVAADSDSLLLNSVSTR
jgi:hypothetical protein